MIPVSDTTSIGLPPATILVGMLLLGTTVTTGRLLVSAFMATKFEPENGEKLVVVTLRETVNVEEWIDDVVGREIERISEPKEESSVVSMEEDIVPGCVKVAFLFRSVVSTVLFEEVEADSTIIVDGHDSLTSLLTPASVNIACFVFEGEGG
jgi:hypothetical protein